MADAELKVAIAGGGVKRSHLPKVLSCPGHLQRFCKAKEVDDSIFLRLSTKLVVGLD